MSLELIQRAICEDAPDYESLLSNLSIVSTLITCDKDGYLAQNTAYEILIKLFKSGNDGCKPNSWFDIPNYDDGSKSTNSTNSTNSMNSTNTTCKKCKCMTYYSCFQDLMIYYYSKECDIESKPWKPEKSKCIIRALELIKHNIRDSCSTFREIVDSIVLYLITNISNIKYEDALTLIHAICDALKQRIYMDRLLKKSAMTLNKLDI